MCLQREGFPFGLQDGDIPVGLVKQGDVSLKSVQCLPTPRWALLFHACTGTAGMSALLLYMSAALNKKSS